MTNKQQLQAATLPPDYALLGLGEKFLAYWHLQKQTFARNSTLAYSNERAEEDERAIDLVSGMVEKIARTPATTLQGLRVKAMALRWCHDGDVIAEDFLVEDPCTDMRLAALIARDILEATGGQDDAA